MAIETVEDFMAVAADNGVTFRIVSDGTGFRFAVGWPNGMDKALREDMLEWVDAHDKQLAETLIGMADEIRNGALGTTIIEPRTLQ